MPKRNPPESPRRTAPSPSGPLAFLFLWPFLLLNFFTRKLPPLQRWLVRIIGHPALAALGVFAVLALIYGFRASRYDLHRIHAMPERSVILDRLGEEIDRIHGEKRKIVPLSQVAESFRRAILAREDERFYQHGATDPIGIVRATIKNFQGKREGASTITQQLASDVFQLKKGEKRGDLIRQLNRKCLEIAIATRIESFMDKDAILQAYINQINWGRQIKGVGEASRIYFEKHPAELTLSESALLAGIVRGPDAYNPFRSIDAATRERNSTLDRMVAAKAITRQQADTAKQEPIEVRPAWRREFKESFAMDSIRRNLEIILEQEDIELGGLTITTTIDLRLQRVAEEALDKKLREVERLPGYEHPTRTAWLETGAPATSSPPYLQGAVVVIENRTGAVLSIVGGRNANESRFNRARDAKRQIGSLFKPFVYLAAFDQGIRPTTAISDGPLLPGEIKGAGNWRPANSDGKFGGIHPASYGLVRSRNTMSIRVGNYAGMDNITEVARTAGFTTPVPKNPASILGTWESSPWEIATAYSIFPNSGTRYRPYLISEIKDRNGNILWSTPPLPYQAASEGSAWSVSRILTEVATTGTAAAVKRLGFDKPSAGKTGTTDDFKDAWFAGYTSTLTATVWVGFDQPKKIIQGGFGSTLSLPVWVDIMKTADRLGYRAGQLHSNVNLVSCRLCRLSGKRATAGCEADDYAYTDEVPADIAVPKNDLCPIHPARAERVHEAEIPPPPPVPRAQPVETPPPRATPAVTPPRAQPIESPPPPRATAVNPPRAQPVEDPPPPRALPIR
jgi:penicillin-binding protein 1A